jgi:hypothetical protein
MQLDSKAFKCLIYANFVSASNNVLIVIKILKNFNTSHTKNPFQIITF